MVGVRFVISSFLDFWCFMGEFLFVTCSGSSFLFCLLMCLIAFRLKDLSFCMKFFGPFVAFDLKGSLRSFQIKKKTPTFPFLYQFPSQWGKKKKKEKTHLFLVFEICGFICMICRCNLRYKKSRVLFLVKWGFFSLSFYDFGFYDFCLFKKKIEYAMLVS